VQLRGKCVGENLTSSKNVLSCQTAPLAHAYRRATDLVGSIHQSISITEHAVQAARMSTSSRWDDTWTAGSDVQRRAFVEVTRSSRRAACDEEAGVSDAAEGEERCSDEESVGRSVPRPSPSFSADDRHLGRRSRLTRPSAPRPQNAEASTFERWEGVPWPRPAPSPPRTCSQKSALSSSRLGSA
jgi:hypothetical protein